MRCPLTTTSSRIFIATCIVFLTASIAPAQPGSTARPGPAEKDRLLKLNGGNTESEAAVARGLAWLARQRKDDGNWEFDGSSKDKIAATGMALLPFLGAGQAPGGDAKYAKVVGAGLDWLAGKVAKKTGSLGTNNMYSHAIATIALCDAARLTKDDKRKETAELAVGYIVKAQGRNGSWGYTGPAPSEGDTSIVGWQIQALAAAKLAGIAVEHKVYTQADKFLESVSTDKGAKYGYREKGASQTLTPVGLLSRNSMGTFKASEPAVGKGVEFLKQFPPQKGYYDMYYYYYATRIMILAGGADWHKFWNPKMRDMLIDLQRKDGDDAIMGSWDKDQGFIGGQCGRLGTTALAVLTLEVYYRNPPPPLPKGFEVPGK